MMWWKHIRGIVRWMGLRGEAIVNYYIKNRKTRPTEIAVMATPKRAYKVRLLIRLIIHDYLFM